MALQEAVLRLDHWGKAQMKMRPPSMTHSVELMGIGAVVVDSPVGPGTVTSFSERGMPRVNDVAVAWCVFACGPSLRVFDPAKQAPEEYRR